MIKFLCCILAVGVLFCACASDKGASEATPEPTPQSAEDVLRDEENYKAIINDAVRQYNGTEYFIDAFFNKKVFIIGDKSLVSILAVDGADTATQVPFSSVSSIEKTSFDEFCTVTVTDFSGNSLSISLSTADAEKFADAVNEKL